jgi:hypothetical protein
VPSESETAFGLHENVASLILSSCPITLSPSFLRCIVFLPPTCLIAPQIASCTRLAVESPSAGRVVVLASSLHVGRAPSHPHPLALQSSSQPSPTWTPPHSPLPDFCPCRSGPLFRTFFPPVPCYRQHSIVRRPYSDCSLYPPRHDRR